MLLGMTFVLSKQYSDNLSDNVKRGIRKNIEEGKFLGKGKHGYYKDKFQHLFPDRESFTLLKSAWEKRLKGETVESISNYLNKAKYKKRFKDVHEKKEFKFNKKTLGEVFKDLFYCGVVSYGEQFTNLEKVLDGFVSMVSTETYCKINNIKDSFFNSSPKRSLKQGVKADLLRGCIICHGCGKNRTAGITTKKLVSGEKKKIFYYKYEQRACKFYGKGVRAKVIINFVKNIFQECNFSVKSVYDYFNKASLQEINKNNKAIRAQISSLECSLKKEDISIENTKKLLSEEDDEILKEEFRSDLKKSLKEVEMLKKSINDKKNEEKCKKQAIIGFDKFLELSMKA
jgi:hypothetical protein